MLIDFLTVYLLFIVIFSLLISLFVLKLAHVSARVILPIVLTIIVVPGIIGYLYVTYFASISEVAVPDVVGLPYEEAIIKLATLELNGKYAGSLYSAKLSEGSVVSHRPEAGRKVKVGRVINLLTSSGQRKVLVPNLLGRMVEQAEVVLAAKGLFLGEVKKDPLRELDPGIILSQEPLPEEEVEVGVKVSVTIAVSVEALSLPEEQPVKKKEQQSPPIPRQARDSGREGWFWEW